jgi:hypothetical protein
MKKQVQQPGVRKWFGDDFISIQDELYDVLEGFFGGSGQQFVLSGCNVAGNNISAGIVGLIDGTGFHLCKFAGAQGVAWPLYLHPSKVTETRVYVDLQVKPVTETWAALTSGNNPDGYLELKQDGTTARFFNTIQSADLLFVTGAEKEAYAGQAAAAVNTLRGGVSGDYDTLNKIVTLYAGQAAAAITAVRGGVSDDYDTLNKIVTLITNVAAASVTEVITANTNAVKGKTYVLTASLVLTLPANPAVGDPVKVSNMSGVLTCVIGRNGKKIMGLSEDLTIDELNAGMELVYSGATQGWVII